MRDYPKWSEWMTIVLTAVPIIGLFLLHPVVSDTGTLSGFFGLVLNVIGATVIALPDLPRLHRYALPKPLRHSWNTLQDEQQLTPSDEGFETLVDLINRKNGRISYDRTCNLLNVDYSVYGNPTISAGFEDGKPPRYTVTKWDIMERWIADHRDNVRAPGFIIFISGFVYQILGYFL